MAASFYSSPSNLHLLHSTLNVVGLHIPWHGVQQTQNSGNIEFSQDFLCFLWIFNKIMKLHDFSGTGNPSLILQRFSRNSENPKCKGVFSRCDSSTSTFHLRATLTTWQSVKSSLQWSCTLMSLCNSCGRPQINILNIIDKRLLWIVWPDTKGYPL